LLPIITIFSRIQLAIAAETIEPAVCASIIGNHVPVIALLPSIDSSISADFLQTFIVASVPRFRKTGNPTWAIGILLAVVPGSIIIETGTPIITLLRRFHFSIATLGLWDCCRD
jgi:hypothetical protein